MSVPISDQPAVMTTGQAARLCSVKPDTVLKWIKKGKLPATRTAGGHYRVAPRDLEPFMPVRPVDGHPGPRLGGSGRTLRCWEYMDLRGEQRDECKACVVYRSRASWCFAMADLESDIGHAKLYCDTSCQTCAYYRRVRGLPTYVLIVTSDEELIERVGREQNESVKVRCVRNAYEASATIHSFRPAFAVVDHELIATTESQLLVSLAGDLRLPGLKIIVAVPHGMGRRLARNPEMQDFHGVIEKPFGAVRIATVINGFPVELPEPGDEPAAAVR
ncbi:helix-turn-helix domain-containing protein [Planctomycetota bacterium]